MKSWIIKHSLLTIVHVKCMYSLSLVISLEIVLVQLSYITQCFKNTCHYLNQSDSQRKLIMTYLAFGTDYNVYLL